jgi:hypothetical protein
VPTKKQLANLKRGGAPPTAQRARKAREAKAAHAAEERRLAELAAQDPYAAYEELHGLMTRHIVKLVRQESRSSAKPSRDVTDRLREYRQLTEALAEYRRSAGAEGMADAFFATIEERLRSGSINLAPGSGPRPYIEPPEEEDDGE